MQSSSSCFACNRTFELKLFCVQMQAGANDCGLFVTAFAAEKPGSVFFNQPDMRNDLRKCFLQREITKLPVN